MQPATRVIEKCGGVKKTAEICDVTDNWVYRWLLPESRGGTGGRIPAKAQRRIIAAAHNGHINISPVDFFQGCESPSSDAPSEGAS